jgi:hypothetical protein
MRERFFQLLPFYLNNTLKPDDLAFMTQYLREHPGMQNEVDVMRAIATQVHASAAVASENIGLDKVLARIALEKPAAGKARTEAGFWRRLLGDGGWLKPAFAMSLAIMALQSWLLWQSSTSQETRYRGGAVNPGAEQNSPKNQIDTSVFFSVQFQPTASEAQLRLLLAGMQADIVAGPGAGGEYIIALPAAHMNDASAQFERSGLVINVQPSAGPR